MKKGLYFHCKKQEVFGISLAFVYFTNNIEIQACLLLGPFAIAVGYKF